MVDQPMTSFKSQLNLKVLWHFELAVLFVLLTVIGCSSPAHATRLPPELKKNVMNVFPDGNIRLDGSIETSNKVLYLPVIPEKRGGRKAKLEGSYPEHENPDVFFFKNGWFYLKVIEKGVARTVMLPEKLPEDIRKKLLKCRFPTDLLVPERFVLPESLKGIVGECTVRLARDSAIGQPDFGQHKATKTNAPKSGALFLTSLSTGTITFLDENTLNKVVEFPTEGTPCHMAVANGKVYIADQAKHRILILDPVRKEFLGQIDLPRMAAPKGLAAPSHGKYLYVSESGSNDIAVIETATKKVLMRTKVPAGPSILALTPSGHFVIIISATSGQVSIMSTMNQRVLGTLKVGALPTGIAITPDSKLAYVSNRVSNTVSVIDIAKRKIRNTIKTGTGPTGLALSNDATKLYVANARDNTISVYDTRTNEKISQLDLPLDVDFPNDIYLIDKGNKLLISSEASDKMGLLNLTSLEFEDPISVGHSSHDIIWVPIPQ